MPRIFNRSGLSLIEMMITLVLVSCILGAVWVVYDAGFRTYFDQSGRVGVKAEIGRTFAHWSQELRQAQGVSAAQQASFIFTADMNGDGAFEAIEYSWSGTAGDPLQRMEGSTIHPFVNAVDSMSFSYYDSGNNLLSFPVTAGDVRRVILNLTVQNQDEALTLRSQVRLRNLS